METEGIGVAGFDPNSVRKVVSVQAPQAIAWRVFTEKMGRVVAARILQNWQSQCS